MFRVFIILILISNRCSGQEPSYPAIDSGLNIATKDLQKKGKYEEAIALNIEMIKKSKQRDYNKGAGWGYYNIGNLLCTLNQYEESLKYLALAEKELSKTKAASLKAGLYIETGKVNHYLNLYEIALTYYNKAISESEHIPNVNTRKSVIHYAYACKADNFEFLDQKDSMRIYFQKAYALIPDPITAANIAHYYIAYNKAALDSAAYYLKVGYDRLEQADYGLFQKLVVLRSYGEYYYAKKNYAKALEYYTQSLTIAEQIKKVDQAGAIYGLMADTYKALDNHQKYTDYLFKHNQVKDSLNIADKKALNLSVDKLLKERQSEMEEEKTAVANKGYYTIGILSLVSIVLLFAGYIFYARSKKEKELLIKDQQEAINRQEVVRRELENKVNDAFEEVRQLAMQNDPALLPRFKEVYPEFCKNILTLYPDILSSELSFCAYLKLNFSTKEIAHYTFVTEKAVQTRKSRIRKRFNIPSEEDLYIWMNSI